MSSDSDAPDHLDPAKWADMLGLSFHLKLVLLPKAILSHFFFFLGLVPLSDSSLKIQDETERELVFQDKFVSSITIIPH